MYARAREDQADALADQIVELADSALRGEADPNAVRVAVDARKWVASKLKPRSYGDRVGVAHEANETGKSATLLAPAWLRERLLGVAGSR